MFVVMEEIDFGPQTALFMPSKSGSHLIIFLFLFLSGLTQDNFRVAVLRMWQESNLGSLTGPPPLHPRLKSRN